MDPVIVERTLAGPSQFSLVTDLPCLLTGIKIEGGELLRATVGPAADPTELLDGNGSLSSCEWLPDSPVAVVVEPTTSPSEVTVTASREATSVATAEACDDPEAAAYDEPPLADDEPPEADDDPAPYQFEDTE